MEGSRQPAYAGPYRLHEEDAPRREISAAPRSVLVLLPYISNLASLRNLFVVEDEGDIQHLRKAGE